MSIPNMLDNRICLLTTLLIPCWFSFAEDGRDPVAHLPKLELVYVIGSDLYAFVPDSTAPPRPVFVQGSHESGAFTLYDYHIFQGSAPYSAASDFSWDVEDGVLFTSTSYKLGPNHSTNITAWPIARLNKGSPRQGEADRPVDMEPEEWASWSGANSLSLNPVSAAEQGWLVLRDDGFAETLPQQRQDVHYDFAVINRDRFRLVLSINGRLSAWTFDRSSQVPANTRLGPWRHLRTWSDELRIDGPFLLLQDGDTLVAEQKGTYGLLPVAVDAPSTLVPLVRREGDEPLLVVEDRSAGVNYFVYNGIVLDEKGETVERLPHRLSSEEQLAHLLRVVLDRRSDKHKP